MPRESAAVPLIRQHVASGTIVHADEGAGWDALHASYDMRRVNHSVEYIGGRRSERQSGGELVQPAAARRVGRPSPDQRRVPLSIRERNGVARGSPPRAERNALPTRDRGRSSPSEIENLARLLATERSVTIERPNTLAGLVEKRAEIAGEIAHIRATLRQLIINLDHVDAAIRIFDPSYDVDGIRQKIPSAAHRALRGDITRATLDALRDAPGPMTTKGTGPARHGRARAEHRRHRPLAAFHPAHRRIAAASKEAGHPPVGQRPSVWSIRPLGDRGLVLQIRQHCLFRQNATARQVIYFAQYKISRYLSRVVPVQTHVLRQPLQTSVSIGREPRLYLSGRLFVRRARHEALNRA